MILGVDLGGTKLATALFTEAGSLIEKGTVALQGRTGADVGKLITGEVQKRMAAASSPVRGIGISVPGISRVKTGTVWAPNIPGWEDYPLIDEVRAVVGEVSVSMDSDRACCMLGERWQGNARGCNDAIYLAVGTGIGAGILIDGHILRGSNDIGGSVGWMALDKPFREKYARCGCFEYYASGDGIANIAREMMSSDKEYQGLLKNIFPEKLTAHHVFEAYEQSDEVAIRVFAECVQYWGMAVANLISIFNPAKIIFGGGVFGPALRFLQAIHDEARKWAQPISMKEVVFEPSGLHGDAAIFGAGYLALESHPDDNREPSGANS